MAGGAVDEELLTSVGNLGDKILAALPPEAVALFQPHIDAIVEAIFRSFSMATSATFVPGIVTAFVAAGLVLLLRDPSSRTIKVEGGVPMMG